MNDLKDMKKKEMVKAEDLKSDIGISIRGLHNKGFSEAGVPDKGLDLECQQFILFTCDGTKDGQFVNGQSVAVTGDKLMALAVEKLLDTLIENNPRVVAMLAMRLLGGGIFGGPEPDEDKEEAQGARDDSEVPTCAAPAPPTTPDIPTPTPTHQVSKEIIN